MNDRRQNNDDSPQISAIRSIMRRTANLLLAFAFLVIPVAAAAQVGIIDTYAGGGPNNLPAVEANLSPESVAVDSEGNFYVVSGHRVFKIDSAGHLTVAAGNGFSGFSGDGGAATSARLANPFGVTVDGSGNLFIGDLFNRRIRKVDAATGIITTVAGNGLSGFSGDGGAATNASLGTPRLAAVDSAGNLYIADESNHRIRKVDTSGIISTVAGNGVASFSGDGGLATSASLWSPRGVAVDDAGNLFIADLRNNRIRKVGSSGIITTVAGNGTVSFSGDGGVATSASLNLPFGVVVDDTGNLFIADTANNRIRKVDTGGVISTVAGNGGFGFSGDGGAATNARVGAFGVAVDGAGNLYIADFFNDRIRKVGSSGIITTVAGNGTVSFSGDGVVATSASLANTRGVAVDSAGNLFIADQGNHRIRKVDTSGIISTLAGNGSLFFSGDGGAATSAGLRFPLGIAVDDAGNLFIATSTPRIRKVDAATGNITTVAGNGSFGFSGDGGPATSARLGLSPSGVSVDSAGNLFIADTGNDRIRKVDTSGIISTVSGNGIAAFSGDGGLATSASLRFPFGVAVDSAGNLFIADTGNSRIRKVDAATGIITTVAGNDSSGFSGDGGAATSASLSIPRGVAVDGAGNLFIADQGNRRIRKVDAVSGIITTVAGNGSFGFSGDASAATSASLANPFGVAVDDTGNLFIADTGNSRIRRVQPLTTAIQGLVDAVVQLNLRQGISNSLDAKLQAVLQALDDVNENNNVAAIYTLQAFINAVEAQRGKNISEADADALIAAAQQIIAVLDGGL